MSYLWYLPTKVGGLGLFNLPAGEALVVPRWHRDLIAAYQHTPYVVDAAQLRELLLSMISLTLNVRGLDQGVTSDTFSLVLENLALWARTPEEVFGDKAAALMPPSVSGSRCTAELARLGYLALMECAQTVMATLRNDKQGLLYSP